MDLELTGKVAVITGASRGVGKAIARELAKEGVDVAICARHREALEEAAGELEQETGRRILPVTDRPIGNRCAAWSRRRQ